MSGWETPLLMLALLPLLLGAWLAGDGARRLGDALTAELLVTRTGPLIGRADLLDRTGAIGWKLKQSWFQRRIGRVTLVATTSAGRQGYRVVDVPEQDAVALADAATPGLLNPFVVEAAQIPI